MSAPPEKPPDRPPARPPRRPLTAKSPVIPDEMRAWAEAMLPPDPPPDPDMLARWDAERDARARIEAFLDRHAETDPELAEALTIVRAAEVPSDKDRYVMAAPYRPPGSFDL